LKINYKINDRFDFLIFIPVILLVCLGLVAIYSATVNHPVMNNNFNKQLIFVGVSLVIFFIVYFLPYNLFRLVSTPAYLFSIFLLVVVLLVGRKINGAVSWLSFGPIGLQPAEFAKLGTILFLSGFLSKVKGDINNFKDISLALVIGGIPMFLILLQPDVGTLIVFTSVILVMVFWSGISLFSLFVVLSPGIIIFASMFDNTYIFIAALVLILGALIYFKRDLFISASIFVMNLAAGFFFDFGFKLLRPHQQKRILTFLDPNADPMGSGYNIIQAKVAIGSGGFWGKGFMEGPQTQNKFIPEQWTDFIYCVIGEEFGFVGSVLVVVLFMIIFFRILDITSLAKDHYSSLILIGILTLLFTHFAINVGMNVGVAPVIGIPLPFFSYGGSSLIINMVLIGIVLNIYRNRKVKA